MNAFRRVLTRVSAARPVLLDVAGLTFVAAGVFLLETSRLGWWAVVAGIGFVLGTLRTQT